MLKISNFIDSPFHSLLKPHRYKVFYGGRGGAKSWAFARALLIMGALEDNGGIRVLCAREIQRSITDSVHRLLVDQIKLLSKEIPGFDDYYEVKKNEIVGGRGATIFSFIGLYTNVNQIKSYEGVDYCWVEEAESISQKSWDLLIPTIRKKDSEIWVSFNPNRSDDPTYETLIKQKLPNSVVKYITFKDNKYFGEPLKSEMELCKKRNYSKYRHIWLGEPIANYESLVYRFDRNINVTNKEYKYSEKLEHCESWDFGIHPSDTVINFYQIIKTTDYEKFPSGVCIIVFDEIVNNNKKASWYRKAVDDKKYLINHHYCDPSGKTRDSGLSSWIDKLKLDERKLNPWHFEYTHKYTRAEMIDNANDLALSFRWNQHQVPHFHKMAFSWQMRTDKNDNVIEPPVPNHDEFSHPGTAHYYFTTNRFPPKSKAKVRVIK